MNFPAKLHHFISNQFPDHIRADHPILVQFLEAYYKYLDTTDKPANLLLNSANWSDIDLTLAEFVPFFRKQYAVDIPTTALLGARKTVKYINEYYEAKGSENATKTFFRLMFNEPASVVYPGDFILRASDGKWVRRRIIKLDASGFSEGNVFDLKGQTIDLRYVEFIPNQGRIIRSVKTTCFNVTRQIEPNIYKLEVSLSKNYVFPDLISEVTNTDIDGDGVPETIGSLGDYDTHVYVVLDGKVYGSLSKQIIGVDEIVDPGKNFKVDDAYNISQTGIEGRYFALSGPDGYVDDIAGPYVFEQFDNNAIIRVSRITDKKEPSLVTQTGMEIRYFFGNGPSGYVDDPAGPYVFDVNSSTRIIGKKEMGIDQINIVATGQKFLARELNLVGDTSYFEKPTNPIDSYVFNVLNPGEGPDDYAKDQQQLIPVNTFSVTLPPRAPRNITGESAQIIFRTGMVYEQNGTFRDSSGFLSDINKLQDNYYYQPYSYVVQTQQQKSVWEDVFLQSNHPAGFKLFSVLQFLDVINAGATVSDKFVIFGPDEITIDILQGLFIVASRTLSLTESWTDTDFVLSPSEIALITDPDSLTVRITKGGADSDVLVSKLSLTLSGI